MANFVSNDNATDLMNAINQKKDTKPGTITWDEWIALTDEQREGTHYIITDVPASFSSKDAVFALRNVTLEFTNKTAVITDARVTSAAYLFTFYYNEAVAQAAGIDCTWGNGTITFTVDENPTSDITLDILAILPALSPGGNDPVQSDWNQTDNTALDYIKNKPTIPAAQVNADWNASSGVAEILNKPTIPAAQVNSDWNSSSGVSEILNKPTTLSGYGITDAYTKTQADNKLNSRVEILIPSTITNHAAYKNAGGNRGKDITEYFTDGTLWKRIAGTDGFEPFEDLYLWDYIVLADAITAPDSSSTGTKNVHIGEFNALNNYQLNTQSSMSGYFNHLLMVPDTHFGQVKMNSSNTTENGYVGSNMHTAILGQYDTAGSISAQLYAKFGSHLKKTKELLTNSINASGYNRFGSDSGCSNNWGWYDCYSVLLSEVETYGSIVWSSSGYDTGNAKKQIAAFKNDEQAMFPQGIYFWLKDVATSTYFCHASGYGGNADYHTASSSMFVRPRFIIA